MINETMKEDLLGYQLIVARESITWNAMQQIGAKTVLFPDPAFYLKPKKREIPSPILTPETGEPHSPFRAPLPRKSILLSGDFPVLCIPFPHGPGDVGLAVFADIFRDSAIPGPSGRRLRA